MIAPRHSVLILARSGSGTAMRT